MWHQWLSRHHIFSLLYCGRLFPFNPDLAKIHRKRLMIEQWGKRTEGEEKWPQKCVRESGSSVSSLCEPVEEETMYGTNGDSLCSTICANRRPLQKWKRNCSVCLCLVCSAEAPSLTALSSMLFQLRWYLIAQMRQRLRPFADERTHTKKKWILLRERVSCTLTVLSYSSSVSFHFFVYSVPDSHDGTHKVLMSTELSQLKNWLRKVLLEVDVWSGTASQQHLSYLSFVNIATTCDFHYYYIDALCTFILKYWQNVKNMLFNCSCCCCGLAFFWQLPTWSTLAMYF